MSQMIGKRLLSSVPLLFFIALVAFSLVKLAPGDPVQTFVTPNMSPEDVARIRASLGLDLPLYMQFWIWLKNLLQGNMGFSLMNHRPVLDLVVERIPATAGLMGVSIVLALVMAIPLGLLAGANRNKWIDKLLNLISYVGISIPTFWLSMLLIYLFALKLNLLPSMGMRTIGVESTADVIKHGILPCIVLAFGFLSVYIRYVRSSTIGQLKEDYVQLQYAYGSSRWTILLRHVLKNVLLPIITLLGMALPDLITGAIVTETVFSWPGLGSMMVTAVFQFDYPIIMGVTIFSSLLLIIGNLLADLLYSAVDPRIRNGR
ncbi:ABC transporter permease [Brevibacillus fluminis]|uniref:ABC transporter permease n=1 Tax=Brevibacillus fluminis TaxID=511487 RepID=A0A3M8CW97_9BACL|nr:ABC transporter permease [Brevibacillus fluminis]RNB79631.1 ABC transporter permease [Brevibacillus fluminis]